MATPNKFLEQPARGSNVGVWDTPVNSNTGIIDNSFGGMATIALTNSPVVLSSAQYQCAFITFTGALSGNCAISFPNVGSWYTVQNLTSNTSAFQVTLQSTVAGTQVIGCPWGEAFDIMSDSAGNMKFRNLGRIGSYWDDCGSSVPAWVSNCTVPPYLACDGSAFSSATYPILATRLGGTTLPDARGRYRATLNSGTGRITSGSSTGGIDGDTKLSAGGSQTTTLSSQHIALASESTGHNHTMFSSATAGTVTPVTSANQPTVVNSVGSDFSYVIAGISLQAVYGLTGRSSQGSDGVVTVGSSNPDNFSNLPPTYIAGITMIRAG